MEVSQFKEKLDKVEGNVYVIEETVQIVNGIYEAELIHDNVNVATIAVYTGPKLTGNRINSYAISTPSMTPWKRVIRIYADVPRVYISYETDGDTVEAEDINKVQEAVIVTQKAVNSEVVRAETAERILTDKLSAETNRAEKAEKVLTDNLSAEAVRAQAAEKANADNLAAEVIRAKAVEKTVADNLTVETDRAKIREDGIAADLAAENNRAFNAENALAEDLTIETIRAKAEEKTLTDNLAGETARAEEKETEISGNLSSEIARAKVAEKTLTDNLTAEATRAKGVEKTLTDNLAAEITRAKAAEKINADAISTETARSKAAEKANADSITAESTRAKAKEEELQTNVQNEAARATAAEDAIRNTITTNTPKWNDKYTKNEVDNKFSALETAIDWKEAVATFASLATAYPHPEDGWTVNVKDTDYTYRWSGTAWIAISANAIPKATQSVDGLLSKEDKTALDDTSAKKHTHSNKTTLDKLTETLLTNWTDAYNKRHEHGNKAVIDKITQALLDNWSAAYSHISDAVKHITAAERTAWNNKVDKVSGKGLSTNDYTTTEKNKLKGITAGAEVNVQADWNVVDESSDAYIKNKPSAMPASDVLAWAKAANKPAYSWTEITNRPTKISQFTNDSGYITQADVDTSQNHSHTNIAVLSKITQAMLDKLAGIAEGANKYVHPTTAGNKHIPAGGASGQILRWSAAGTAVWGTDNNTTYSAFKAATASAAGGTGLVPAPAAGAQTKYLRGDGSWQTPPDTKYSHPNSGVAAGDYQSVTVNAQGHVTGGVPKGAFTWAQLKGAYTWGDLKGGS